MKKVMAICALLTLFIAGTAQADFVDGFAEDNGLDEMTLYSDVAIDHVNHRAINLVTLEEIIEGYPDGTFRPDSPINRAELTKIAVVASFDSDIVLDSETYNNCFDDVTDQWYAPYICYAAEQGWIQGYDDGTFRPANNVNRVEAMKILLEIAFPEGETPQPTEEDLAVSMPVDLDMTQWYKSYMRFAIVKELVDGQHVMQDPNGDLYYFPDGDMTRKEVVEAIYRFVIYIVERDTYGQAMGEYACFLGYNEAYVDSLSDTDRDKYLYFIFSMYSWNEQEAAEVIFKYAYDNVADEKMIMYTKQTCGEGVEYDNWILDSVDL